ncbi:hypothetical protein GP486_000294 [Trichoglossum hirsutum]|uniref:Mitochondrial import inner membrane translocase subunit TIM50 n=1 Tax=Trichoglossum hirsutum TaxID=265104 RepID=A0A9P8RTQ6_9PEZI|nr:hypothetical protein GP486_000294 [Trichoglossum hirsutum]
MGNARTEATKQRRERKHARKAKNTSLEPPGDRKRSSYPTRHITRQQRIRDPGGDFTLQRDLPIIPRVSPTGIPRSERFSLVTYEQWGQLNDINHRLSGFPTGKSPIVSESFPHSNKKPNYVLQSMESWSEQPKGGFVRDGKPSPIIPLQGASSTMHALSSQVEVSGGMPLTEDGSHSPSGPSFGRRKVPGVVKPKKRHKKNNKVDTRNNDPTRTSTCEQLLGKRGEGRVVGMLEEGFPSVLESSNAVVEWYVTFLLTTRNYLMSGRILRLAGSDGDSTSVSNTVSEPGSRERPLGLDAKLSSTCEMISSGLRALDTAKHPTSPNKALLHSNNTNQQASPVRGGTSRTLVLPVPQPTEEYLLQTNQPTQELDHPRDVLLVLDLNGTLLHRRYRSRSQNFVARPHTEEFLQYLLGKFSVMIWSSATPASVSSMCRRLFTEEQRGILVAEWGRDKLGLTPEQYRQKIQVYKQLEKVWDSDVIAASHPGYDTGGRWNQTNTILLDDSALKASAQPYNHISVPEFKGGRESEDRRSVFNQVMGYLEAIVLQQDVSSYIRKDPFRVAEGWDTRRPRG